MDYRRSILVVLFITFVQYYNYSLFGISAVNLSNAFLCPSNDAQQLTLFFLIFALATIAKPLGSIIFGLIGDNYGRSVALKSSSAILIISSILIIVLPEYSKVGIASSITMLLARMLVLMSVASEGDGARVYITELTGKKSQYLSNGFIVCFTQVGVLFASLSSFVLDYYQLNFRILFLVGALLGTTAFLLRGFVIETDEFYKLKASGSKISIHDLRTIISSVPRTFGAFIILFGAIGGIYTFHVIFMYSYFIKVLKLQTPYTIKMVQTVSILGFLISSICSGYIADRYKNITRQICFGIKILVATTLINMIVLILYDTALLSLHFLSVLIIPIYSCILQIYIKNNMPRVGIYSLYSLAHSIGSIVLSGTTPMISNYCYSSTELLYAPYIHLLFLIALLYASFCYINKRAKSV